MKQNLTNVLVLANRSNGRVICDIVASGRLSSATLCVVAKRCVRNLLLIAYIIYEKSIGTKINGLDLCLEVV